MQSEYNGLKSLILKENEYAYYIHCFANQLQLALMGLAKNRIDVCRRPILSGLFCSFKYHNMLIIVFIFCTVFVVKCHVVHVSYRVLFLVFHLRQMLFYLIIYCN